MAVRSRIVTVTTTASPLISDNDRDSNPGYRDVAVNNTSGVTVLIGGPDLTVGNGFPIAAGAALSFDAVAADSIPYVLVATGTADVAVLELGV